MNDDFILTRKAFSESVPGRSLRVAGERFRSAWETSSAARAGDGIAVRWAALPPASRLSMLAGAIAVAAVLQPLLDLLMPRTVVPALSGAAFVTIALFAAVIAWRPQPFVSAWRDSRLGRWSRR